MNAEKTLSNSFKTNRKFYDDKNYPKGLNRSGDFTLNEVKILEDLGVALQELMNGTREPVNDEEKQFIEVCQGNIEASTKIEKTWKKYQNKVLSPKHFHTLFGRTKVDSDEDTAIVDNDTLDLDMN